MANGRDNYFEGEAGYLIVKISKGVGHPFSESVYAVPDVALEQYRIELKNLAEFEGALPDPKRVNVEFAVYTPEVTVRGPGG